jgi:hypothetical protein
MRAGFGLEHQISTELHGSLGPKYSSSAYITQPVSILVSVLGIRLAVVTVDADGSIH